MSYIGSSLQILLPTEGYDYHCIIRWWWDSSSVCPLFTLTYPSGCPYILSVRAMQGFSPEVAAGTDIRTCDTQVGGQIQKWPKSWKKWQDFGQPQPLEMTGLITSQPEMAQNDGTSYLASKLYWKIVKRRKTKKEKKKPSHTIIVIHCHWQHQYF